MQSPLQYGVVPLTTKPDPQASVLTHTPCAANAGRVDPGASERISRAVRYRGGGGARRYRPRLPRQRPGDNTLPCTVRLCDAAGVKPLHRSTAVELLLSPPPNPEPQTYLAGQALVSVPWEHALTVEEGQEALHWDMRLAQRLLDAVRQPGSAWHVYAPLLPRRVPSACLWPDPALAELQDNDAATAAARIREHFHEQMQLAGVLPHRYAPLSRLAQHAPTASSPPMPHSQRRLSLRLLSTTAALI